MARYDVVILGAGAAGLFCAATAGQRGRRVAVVEHAGQVGKKILISGGGRCNFTNLNVSPSNFLSQNPHFAKSALARYTPQDFVRLVESYRIPFHEKTLGQLFCDRSATDITNLLLSECAKGAVKMLLEHRVNQIRRTTEFILETNRGEIQGGALLVATGGLSVPKIGATDLGYRIAKQFGHKVVPCFPALVPLTFDESFRSRYCDLAGVATEVVASYGAQSFREKMLITHRGLSGPAILQVSTYWNGLGRGDLNLDLTGTQLPRRLAQRWAEVEGVDSDRHTWRVTPSGTEGFGKAEVTGGGVSTDELSSKTMESRHQPGLFFIGEVVDVTGQLGGYNFQWAWASGHASGQAV